MSPARTKSMALSLLEVAGIAPELPVEHAAIASLRARIEQLEQELATERELRAAEREALEAEVWRARGAEDRANRVVAIVTVGRGIFA